ncbi:translation initiation factor IF-2-like [Phacochoerus africanus]|uniref:translation initiation factor IF-2-like n=1 Tax=Phacochoerus africanus TaxID=41426 RepID=UPI001FD90FF6|nr:translation initiation factor IF-2-like [Phacochoerus africanus]
MSVPDKGTGAEVRRILVGNLAHRWTPSIRPLASRDSGYFDALGCGSPDPPHQPLPRRKTNSVKIKWGPKEARGKPGGHAAPEPRRRPHLPGEAAARGRGSAADKGQPGPGPSLSALLGGRPGSRGQSASRGARSRLPARPPGRPASLPAADAAAPAPARRPAAAPASAFTHLARLPRLPHVTARPRAPRHQQRGRGRTPGDPARQPPPPPPRLLRLQAADSEPVAQPVTAARAPRRRLSPTTTWRPRPPQEAGGRGGRRRAGQLTARPPPGTDSPTLRNLKLPRRGSAPPEPRVPNPAGLVLVLRSPLGEAPKPRTRQPFLEGRRPTWLLLPEVTC